MSLIVGPPARGWTSSIGDLNAAEGVQSHLLNADIFVRVWRRIAHEGRFLRHSWVVKADPDTVFFAGRLKAHLPNQLPSNGSMYFANCRGARKRNGFSFFGAIEVVSVEGIKAYSKAERRCTDELDHKALGEDLFMQSCLDLLEIHCVDDFDLLSDAYCDGGESPVRPCNTGKVAYHPLKTVGD